MLEGCPSGISAFGETRLVASTQPKQGAVSFTALKLESYSVGVGSCGVRSHFPPMSGSAKRTRPITPRNCYARMKAPSEFAAKPSAPCFSFVDSDGARRTLHRDYGSTESPGLGGVRLPLAGTTAALLNSEHSSLSAILSQSSG